MAAVDTPATGGEYFSMRFRFFFFFLVVLLEDFGEEGLLVGGQRVIMARYGSQV